MRFEAELFTIEIAFIPADHDGYGLDDFNVTLWIG
jgi:hypothetical protein